MKILHLNYGDQYSGGAGRAAYRLHQGLRHAGIDSTMLVSRKQTDDPTVLGPTSKLAKLSAGIRPHVARLYMTLLRYNMANEVHSVNILPGSLHRRINQMDVDLIHLHWINDEMISIADIARFNKPVVWTFHDMWPFCGTEHYVDRDHSERYQKGYGFQNRPAQVKGIDLDRKTWQRKKRRWKNLTLNIVTPSQWLADCVKQSALLGTQSLQVIPNGLDPEVYKPVESHTARQLLNLPQDKKLILFGAVNAVSDYRKGAHFLKPIFDKLIKIGSKNVELVVFGASGPKNNEQMPLKCHYLGHLYDEVSLMLAYSAANVFIAPSMQDNLPNTIMESMACQTPCVAFDIGGMKDMIAHCQTGYLARPYDCDDFSQGINWVLNENESLRSKARQKIESCFLLKDITRRYYQLYTDILAKQ